MRRILVSRKRRQNILPLARAFGVIAAIVVIVSGVTFAALQSQQAKLTGNTIQTATANLQISSDGSTYGNTQAGFSFDNLVPGGQAVPASGYTLYLKNMGGTPLALKFAVSGSPTNPDAVDLTKVHVIVTPVGGGSPQNFTLQSLLSGYATGGQALLSPSALLPGQTVQYVIQVSMDTDAVTGPGATISTVDFSFSGLAQSN